MFLKAGTRFSKLGHVSATETCFCRVEHVSVGQDMFMCYDQFVTSISVCGGDFEVFFFQVSELYTGPGERKRSSLSPGGPLTTVIGTHLGRGSVQVFLAAKAAL